MAFRPQVLCTTQACLKRRNGLFTSCLRGVSGVGPAWVRCAPEVGSEIPCVYKGFGAIKLCIWRAGLGFRAGPGAVLFGRKSKADGR